MEMCTDFGADCYLYPFSMRSAFKSILDFLRPFDFDRALRLCTEWIQFRFVVYFRGIVTKWAWRPFYERITWESFESVCFLMTEKKN